MHLAAPFVFWWAVECSWNYQVSSNPINPYLRTYFPRRLLDLLIYRSCVQSKILFSTRTDSCLFEAVYGWNPTWVSQLHTVHVSGEFSDFRLVGALPMLKPAWPCYCWDRALLLQLRWPPTRGATPGAPQLSAKVGPSRWMQGKRRETLVRNSFLVGGLETATSPVGWQSNGDGDPEILSPFSGNFCYND